MNSSQRTVLVIAALAVAGMAIYPPWIYKGGTSAGYSWIFTPPPSTVPSPTPPPLRLGTPWTTLSPCRTGNLRPGFPEYHAFSSPARFFSA